MAFRQYGFNPMTAYQPQQVQRQPMMPQNPMSTTTTMQGQDNPLSSAMGVGMLVGGDEIKGGAKALYDNSILKDSIVDPLKDALGFGSTAAGAGGAAALPAGGFASALGSTGALGGSTATGSFLGAAAPSLAAPGGALAAAGGSTAGALGGGSLLAGAGGGTAAGLGAAGTGAAAAGAAGAGAAGSGLALSSVLGPVGLGIGGGYLLGKMLKWW